jgi:hypothetical protein
VILLISFPESVLLILTHFLTGPGSTTDSVGTPGSHWVVGFMSKNRPMYDPDLTRQPELDILVGSRISSACPMLFYCDGEDLKFGFRL